MKPGPPSLVLVPRSQTAKSTPCCCSKRHRRVGCIGSFFRKASGTRLGCSRSNICLLRTSLLLVSWQPVNTAQLACTMNHTVGQGRRRCLRLGFSSYVRATRRAARWPRHSCKPTAAIALKLAAPASSPGGSSRWRSRSCRSWATTCWPLPEELERVRGQVPLRLPDHSL